MNLLVRLLPRGNRTPLVDEPLLLPNAGGFTAANQGARFIVGLVCPELDFGVFFAVYARAALGHDPI